MVSYGDQVLHSEESVIHLCLKPRSFNSQKLKLKFNKLRIWQYLTGKCNLIEKHHEGEPGLQWVQKKKKVPKQNTREGRKEEQFLYACFSKSQIERGGGNYAFFLSIKRHHAKLKRDSPSLFLSGHSNQIMQKDPSDPNKVKKWPFTWIARPTNS